jgi:hypothetical protein
MDLDCGHPAMLGVFDPAGLFAAGGVVECLVCTEVAKAREESRYTEPCGCASRDKGCDHGPYLHWREHHQGVNKAREEEREACAKVADSWPMWAHDATDWAYDQIAATIRARGRRDG